MFAFGVVANLLDAAPIAIVGVVAVVVVAIVVVVVVAIVVVVAFGVVANCVTIICCFVDLLYIYRHHYRRGSEAPSDRFVGKVVEANTFSNSAVYRCMDMQRS